VERARGEGCDADEPVVEEFFEFFFLVPGACGILGGCNLSIPNGSIPNGIFGPACSCILDWHR
jgi:hypothetical protein